MSYSSPTCYVTLCTPREAAGLQQKLTARGYAIDQPSFTRFRARKEGVSCTAYLSGKVLIQGSNLAPFIATFFPTTPPSTPTSTPTTTHKPKSTADTPQIARACAKTPSKHKPCMGFDESGKGDVFGPLCLAGVYVGENQAAQLVEWGVCDSKTLTHAKILTLATKIRTHYPYETLILMPERYNALYEKFRNLNRLLAWGHVELMKTLHQKTQCSHAVLDQFCNPREVESLLKDTDNIALTQRTHAESSEIAVAAASILARAAFVEGMDDLSKKFGLTIPKGATHGIVQAGKRILQQYGEEGLRKTIKLHFKTLTAIRG